MPKTQKTETQQRLHEVKSDLNDLIFRNEIDDEKLGQLIGRCARTARMRRLHPEELTLAEIWSIEKAAGRRFTVPFQKKEI